MKKIVYIFTSMILGVILSSLIHSLAETFIINLLIKDFSKYGFGLNWQTWFLIHNIATGLFFIIGVVFGYFIGQRWWRIIYVEKKYRPIWDRKRNGFSLVEILVVIAIIGIIFTSIFIALNLSIIKARDTKRKAELSQIGRILSSGSCYMPNDGTGEYDLIVLMEELKIKYPQYSSFFSKTPEDPKTGTALESFYRYIVSEDGIKCALYANLENINEPVTLANITVPTAGGGTGVLQSLTPGWNGTDKYFQVSN